MIINHIGPDPKRSSKIEAALPKTSFVDSLLMPVLNQYIGPALLKMLLAEIEVYRNYPKRGEYNEETFNPRNSATCFMGQGFLGNGEFVDKDLAEYRKAIGTINHKTWGDCTLLEIWGADHFEKYPEMVKGVFNYCWGKGELPPVIEFHCNPLFANKASGTYEPNEGEKAEIRKAQLAQENELRRSWGLPAQDYLAEEIETFRKQGKWDEKNNRLKTKH